MIGTLQCTQRGASVWIGALERVERMGGPTDRDLEGLVVRVATALAGLHGDVRLQGQGREDGPHGMRLAEPDPMSRVSQRLRMAVIGQGHFAQAAVLPAIEHLDEVELTRWSRGRSTSSTSSVRATACARSPTTISSTSCSRRQGRRLLHHRPQRSSCAVTLIAARHGIHVICEKPMAPTEAECMQMIRACEQRRVKLMICRTGCTSRPRNLIAVEIARGGEIGEPRIFSRRVLDAGPRRQRARATATRLGTGLRCRRLLP